MKIPVLLIALTFLCSCKKKDLSHSEQDKYKAKVQYRKTLPHLYSSSILCSDGTFLVAATQSWKPRIIKLTPSGDILWIKNFDSLSYISRIIEMENGQYLLVSSKLTLMDEAGNEIWTKAYSMALGDRAIRTQDNNYLIAGTIDNNLCLLKINGNGDSLWQKNIPGQGFRDPRCLLETNDHSILTSDRYGKLVLLNSNSQQIWVKQIDDYPKLYNDLLEIPGKGFLACGQIEGENPSITRSVLLNIGYDGSTISETEYYIDTISERANQIMLNEDQSVTVAGTAEFPQDIYNRFMLFSVSTNGKVLWRFYDDENGYFKTSFKLHKIATDEYIAIGINTADPGTNYSQSSMFFINVRIEKDE